MQLQLQLQLQSMHRDTTVLPDEALGEALVALVKDGVERKAAPAVATVARPERIDLIGLRPVVDSRIPIHPFLASLATAEVEPTAGDARAVGVMGKVWQKRSDGRRGAPMALVFLEWPDCRWWLWRALIDPATETVRDDTETRTRAVDGDPLPPGFGRWWSYARRQNRRARMRMGGAGLVH